MPLPPAVRSLIPLVIGLGVGGVGASMFLDSMPGREGSPEERANRLEAELKRAQNRVAALEATRPGGSRKGGLALEGGATLRDGARKIAEDLRAGRPVSPDDIFKATQPLLRDLAPLFDRMRVKQEQQMVASRSGQIARKYDLTPPQEERLKQWFAQKAEEDARRWSELIAQDGTRLEDVVRASQNVRPDEGLDTFMQGVLSGDKLAAFNNERLTERAQRVESEADAKVQRLHNIVALDDTQRDEVFAIMARGSRDYDPAMVLEGAQGELGPSQGGNRREAMLAVLRPEQRAAYEAEQQRQREAAMAEAAAVGLTLPADWEMFDEDAFR